MDFASRRHDETTCLPTETLVAFRERRLAPAVEDGVDGHLAQCAICRRVLAEVAAMSELAPPDEPLPLSNEGVDRARAELPRRLSRARVAARTGQVLCDRWRIDGLLGSGATCHVFSATHRNGRPVAIKMMRPELAMEPSLVQRFLREGHTANRVGHPGAVAVLDDDVTIDGSPFLVMERLAGESLGRKIRRDGPLPWVDARRIIEATLDVLAQAHDKGIIHRDLKPDNLFLCEDGTIKVLDFGLARMREEAARTAGHGDETRSGTQIGTVGYVAPEQARGLVAEVDARSDVWSVGATFYTLLTGQTLHRAATSNEAFLLAMTTPVRSMRDLAPSLQADQQAFLDTALAFNKKDRFADAAVMRRALDRLSDRQGHRSERRDQTPWWRGRRFVVGVSAVVACTLVLALKGRGTPTVSDEKRDERTATERREASTSTSVGALGETAASPSSSSPDPPPVTTPAASQSARHVEARAKAPPQALRPAPDPRDPYAARR